MIGASRPAAACALALGLALASCTPSPASRPPSAIDGASWRQARRELEALRTDYAPRTDTMRITARLSVQSAEVDFRGRGALARRPPEDLRMILLGPGGTTAFDLLVRGDAWRWKVPARDVLVRSEDEASPRGLPVGFLRWWLLRPLSGTLVSMDDTARGRVLVLRDGDATVRVLRQESGLVMERRSPSGTERMRVSGPGCGNARYEHVDSGVRADVTCESLELRVAAGAFEDHRTR